MHDNQTVTLEANILIWGFRQVTFLQHPASACMINALSGFITGVTMSRKFFQFTILVLTFFALIAVPAQVSGDSEVVAVRIPIEAGLRANRAAVKAERVIDYGSFLWAVMDPKDLPTLDAAGLAYQTIESPYTLTLGGQSFDPLVATPTFGMAWESKTRGSSGGLHLIQFHGPTKDAWLDSLEAAGLDVIQYIHPFTYMVWGDPAALNRSAAQDTVRWAGDYLPAYALTPKNRTLSSEPLLVRASIIPQAGLNETVQAIEALGGQLVGTASGIDPAFDLASFILPGDQLGAAAALPGVVVISPVPLDGGDRGEMSNQINVGNYDGSNLAFPGYLAWLSGLGLSGDGVIIANVDSGIDQTHPDLANRMLPCIGSTCGYSVASDHGTHTAGIMAGDASSGNTLNGFLRGLGMAPGANLVEQVYAPTYTQTGGMLTLMTQSYQNGAVISGNSWGPSSSQLGYDEDTRLVDVGVRDANPSASGNQELSFILSIDNSYGSDYSLGTPDEAKNVFSIGSTEMQNPDGSQLLTINNISSNSAHGPALDGRNIPHLVAPGCYVDSTVGGGYATKCGTSMASPHVSGAVALFIERYRNAYGSDPSPALVKAAFLPVAHDLAGNLDAEGGTLWHPFDSKQGWGRLDAAAVLDPGVVVIYFDQRTLFTNTGETWTFTITSPEPVAYMHAMLVWTDAPGHGLGGNTDAWVNDLDFSVSLKGSTYLGNNFGTDGLSVTGGSADEMNNTEGIFLENTAAGTFTFTVSAAQIAGDGVPNVGDATDQDFALAIYMSPEFLTEHYIFPLFFH